MQHNVQEQDHIKTLQLYIEKNNIAAINNFLSQNKKIFPSIINMSFKIQIGHTEQITIDITQPKLDLKKF